MQLPVFTDPKDALVCNEVKEKQVISFEASISVTEEFCKQKQGSQVLFQLGGFEKDKLKLNVKCERCECGRQIIQNAPQCMNRGSLVCGGCDCKYVSQIVIIKLPFHSLLQ